MFYAKKKKLSTCLMLQLYLFLSLAVKFAYPYDIQDVQCLYLSLFSFMLTTILYDDLNYENK